MTDFQGRFKELNGRAVVTPIDLFWILDFQEKVPWHKESVAGAQCKPKGELEETELFLRAFQWLCVI